MASVSIRDLRNRGGEVVDRVEAGEHVTVTRSGKPVAVLRPFRREPLTSAVLLARWRGLPHVDPVALRGDVDTILDAGL